MELSEEKSQVRNSVIKQKNKGNKQNRLGQMIELANEIEMGRDKNKSEKARPLFLILLPRNVIRLVNFLWVK